MCLSWSVVSLLAASLCLPRLLRALPALSMLVVVLVVVLVLVLVVVVMPWLSGVLPVQ